MARRGTKAKINLGELEKLCAIQATDEEVAAWFEVSVRTIERRRKNPKFAEIMARGKAKGRLSVRRWQMKLLEAGNATMGVWLGKQLLQQTDHVDYRLEEASVIRLICLSSTGTTGAEGRAPSPARLPAPEPAQLIGREEENGEAEPGTRWDAGETLPPWLRPLRR